MKTIELITPAYNEESCVIPFYEAIRDLFDRELKNYEYIITYVDDGSKDHTLENIKKVIREYPEENIRYISFSKNFGKEAAIYAGMEQAVGDYVVLLDIDLQHPPYLIPQMLEAVEKEGYDCATARRISRKGEGWIRSMLSQSFYHVFNRVTAIEIQPGGTDFRLMKNEMAKTIVTLQERERFTKGIYSWIGFNNKWIEYENVERIAGASKWSIKGLAKYSYSGFIAFATAPLRAVIWLGVFITLVDLVWIVSILVAYFKYGATGNGVTTLTLITLFLGGIIITILGMIGEYMARIYMEVKRRPIYITKESNIECEKGDVKR